MDVPLVLDGVNPLTLGHSRNIDNGAWAIIIKISNMEYGLYALLMSAFATSEML